MRKRNRRWLGKIKQILICTGLVLCLVAGAIPSTACYAESLVKPEVVLPKHYPDGFNGYGRILTIGKDDVVIDDEHFKLSPSVTYNTPSRANASKAYFTPGVLAGFLTNAQDEVLSLWLLE